MNELCPLAAAIEAGNSRLPPCIGKLIQNAPESFENGNAGQVAATVRAMRQSGEPVNFEAILQKHLPSLNFVSMLMNSALPLESAEFEAEECWQAFQLRQAKSIGSELVKSLDSQPGQAATIISVARGALDAVINGTANGLPELIDAADFLATSIEPPAELIEGILHKGSKLAFGGSSKSFKTWCLLDLAISVATGENWLGRTTAKGKVLFLNFEIQTHAWQKRIQSVARAKGVEVKAGEIILWNLRGYAADFRKIIPCVI